MRAVVAAMAAFALLLAGCGSSSSGGGSTASSTMPTSSAPAPAAAVDVTTKHSKLGTILGAGPKQLTVYLFEGDKMGASSCTGACAGVWPPVTGTPSAAGAAKATLLGTIKRADGTTQVTYKGHPLYFYAKDVADGDAGDAYGEGVKSYGSDWYVVAPSGTKIDTD